MEKVTNMDFDLSEEQRLLKESIDGLLTDSYDFDARKKYQKEKGGWSKAVWSKLAQQALLGELAPDGLAPAALLLLVLLARIEIVGIGQQTVDAFLEKALLLGQIKIHVRYFLRITKFSPSCPGLSRASTSC